MSDKKDKNMEEQNGETLKFPRAIPFIIICEFCERFCYYGMRAFLVLYLTRKLMFEEDLATIVYHVFTALVYLFCLLGAIIADSFLGKFFTILSFLVVYAVGGCMITTGSVEIWNLPAVVFTCVGLFLIAVGSGGIKPCVAVFGANQFKLPEQAKSLTRYFSLFYFAINLGSFLSYLSTPFLREEQCFEQEDCFPAAFGLPALLMILSIFIFIFGKPLYKITPVRDNMLVKICQCIGNAISTRRREKSTNPKEHWLDYAEAKHGKKLVMETKILLNILVLFIPLPLFWALFDQQGSRWLIQATNMNGDIGFYTIKPDQMQILNPLFILICIPLFEFGWYPLMKLIGLRHPLHKMALGGVLAGLSFVLSMLVQLKMDELQPGELSLLWQIPQYIVITFGEVMFSVTGLEFAYTQAPDSLKSVIQAAWLLTVAFGNMFVIIIVASVKMPHQAIEFGLFAGLMFVDMIIFSLIGFCYKPISLEEVAKAQ